MGYTLIIGEAKLAYDEEQVCVTADAIHDPAAPAYGEPTDHTSARWPSYTAWGYFARALGLWPMFALGEKGSLIPDHPGAAPITAAHVETIREAIAAYRAKHPNARPTFEGEIEENGHLARAEWLLWWCEYAVKNLKQPVFVNS